LGLRARRRPRRLRLLQAVLLAPQLPLAEWLVLEFLESRQSFGSLLMLGSQRQQLRQKI